MERLPKPSRVIKVTVDATTLIMVPWDSARDGSKPTHGRPTHFSVDSSGTNIRLWPAPDDEYVIELSCVVGHNREKSNG